MTAIISHTSALAFWRSALSDSGSAREQCRVKKPPSHAPLAQDLRYHPLVRRGILPLPVHVLAREGRRSSSALAIHTTQPLPAGSLRAVAFPGSSEPLFVTSPELTFVHMASLLSFPLIVHLGYEFCGTFAPDETQPFGLRNRMPLTSSTKLVSYVGEAERTRGAKAARLALPYILDGSASPRESTLAEFLTLPYLRGGSKIERPALNAAVPLPSRSTWASNRSSFRCDLLWRDKKVTVEYDSTLCHTGAERIAHDASRRNALESLGFTVMTATWRHVEQYQEYNRFVRMLASHLGTRVRPTCSDYAARQFVLRRELLDRTKSLPR